MSKASLLHLIAATVLLPLTAIRAIPGHEDPEYIKQLLGVLEITG